jgi:hypothetical protein
VIILSERMGEEAVFKNRFLTFLTILPLHKFRYIWHSSNKKKKCEFSINSKEPKVS